LDFLSSVASSVFICVHLWLDNSLFLAHSSLPDLHPSADQSSLRLLPCGSVSSVVDRFSIFSGRVPSSDLRPLDFLSSVASSVFICVHLWLDNSLFLAHSSLPDLHPSADQSSLRLLRCGSVSSVVDRFSIS
jgi:hypothetical protein